MNNQNECLQCGSELVWRGDMLTGGLVCPHPELHELEPAPEDYDMAMWFPDNDRQSGRTHAMVLRALDKASRGNRVVILAHNRSMVDYIKNMIHTIGVAWDLGANRFTIGQGGVEIVALGRSNPAGQPKDIVVFADHAVYDTSHGAAFDEQLRWWGKYCEILT